MAPLPAVPQVLRVQIQGNSGEATPITWQNILHFAYSGSAPSNATCTTIANHIATEWGTHMSPEQVSNTAQNLVQVVDLTSDISGTGADFTVNVGSRGDDELPANVAYLVTYPVNRRYRGGHPRTYLYVLGISDFLDAAHWSDAATAEVQTHWAAFLNAIVGYSSGGCTISNLVNVSYRSGDAVRVTPVVDILSTSTMIGQQQMASQRRRIGRKRS